MNPEVKVVFGALCALLCWPGAVHTACGQALPDGKGKVEFVHNCTACHRAEMVTRVKKTPAEWRKSVDDMAARGSDGTKEDLDNVVLYLDKYYSTDKPAAAAATPSTPAGSASPSLDSTDSESAKAIIAGNGCLTCHRICRQGAYTGPALNGVGARRTADQIRAALVSPPSTVDPGNELIRLTTADGNTLTARLLSQDDRQVRVIDASGEVSAYAKPELRQSTIIDANPMPSYAHRLTGDDMDILVRYLRTLPSSVDGTQK